MSSATPPTSDAGQPTSFPANRGQPQLPNGLLAVLAALDQPGQIAMLLGDLLTPQETEALGERWQIAQLLSRGEPQRAVADALSVSITTVSRGARSLKYGTGGFELALQTLQQLPSPVADSTR
jgi:Trp operon repressor